MIRQRLLVFALVIAALQAGGCVSVQTASGGRSVMWVVPGLDTGERSNRAGTTYYNERWGTDPGSHPAVSGVPSVGTGWRVAPEGKMAETGSRSASPDDAQTLLSASARGNLSDPCQPGTNYGSLWGGVAGAWLGSLFGGGRGREFFIALGAVGGAVRGTERVADGRRCR